MAVNLTKPFKGVEYTPEHLITEEESISSLTAFAEAEEKNVDIVVKEVANPPVEVKQAKTDLNICMDELIEKIEAADEDTQQRFIKDFFKAAKKKRRAIKKEQSQSYEFVRILLQALPLLISFGVLIAVCLLLPQFGEEFVATFELSETNPELAQTFLFFCNNAPKMGLFFAVISSSVFAINKVKRSFF